MKMTIFDKTFKDYHCSTVSAINFFFAHSGQIISSESVMKPLPTNDPLQEEQTKQSLCQWRPSKEINRVPPIPENSCTLIIPKIKQDLKNYSPSLRNYVLWKHETYPQQRLIGDLFFEIARTSAISNQKRSLSDWVECKLPIADKKRFRAYIYISSP